MTHAKWYSLALLVSTAYILAAVFRTHTFSMGATFVLGVLLAFALHTHSIPGLTST